MTETPKYRSAPPSWRSNQSFSILNAGAGQIVNGAVPEFDVIGCTAAIVVQRVKITLFGGEVPGGFHRGVESL
jgi:hypothetical protein